MFDVASESDAWDAGVEPDMVVTELNGVWVLDRGFQEVMAMINSSGGSLSARFTSKHNAASLLLKSKAVLKIQRWYRATGFWVASRPNTAELPNTSAPAKQHLNKINSPYAARSPPYPAVSTLLTRRRLHNGVNTLPIVKVLEDIHPSVMASGTTKTKSRRRSPTVGGHGVAGVKGAHRVPDAMRRLHFSLSSSDELSSSPSPSPVPRCSPVTSNSAAPGVTWGALSPLSRSPTRSYSAFDSGNDSVFDSAFDTDGERTEDDARASRTPTMFTYLDDDFHSCESVASSPLANSNVQAAGSPEVVMAKRFSVAQCTEDGERLRIVGCSTMHGKSMGVYNEIETQYNSCPVYRRDATNGTQTFMYYAKKKWRLSSVVGRKKCVISATTSTKSSPSAVTTLWCERKGPNDMRPLNSIKVVSIENRARVSSLTMHPEIARKLCF